MKKVIAITLVIVIAMSIGTIPAYAKTTNKGLIKEYCKEHYPDLKIKYITFDDDTSWDKILHRKGKNVVYVEKCISKSSGKKCGYTVIGHYYTAYNKKVKKGKKVTSYFIWNPYTNYCDDVVAAVDNKKIR